jgi:methyl-accepting chemotaxis protein
MSHKNYTKQTLETLVELVDLKETVNRQATNLDRMTQSIDRMAQSVDRMAASTDRLAHTIDGHLQVTQQQSANVAELTKLVTAQANTVNRLIEKVAA